MLKCPSSNHPFGLLNTEYTHVCATHMFTNLVFLLQFFVNLLYKASENESKISKGKTAFPSLHYTLELPGELLKLRAYLVLLYFTDISFFYKLKAIPSTSKKIDSLYCNTMVMWNINHNISEVCCT